MKIESNEFAAINALIIQRLDSLELSLKHANKSKNQDAIQSTKKQIATLESFYEKMRVEFYSVELYNKYKLFMARLWNRIRDFLHI